MWCLDGLFGNFADFALFKVVMWGWVIKFVLDLSCNWLSQIKVVLFLYFI